jgi:hypothetical protein
MALDMKVLREYRALRFGIEKRVRLISLIRRSANYTSREPVISIGQLLTFF